MSPAPDFKPKFGQPISMVKGELILPGTRSTRDLQVYQDMYNYMLQFKEGKLGPDDGYSWNIIKMSAHDKKHLSEHGVPEENAKTNIIMCLRSDIKRLDLTGKTRIRQQDEYVLIGGLNAMRRSNKPKYLIKK